MKLTPSRRDLRSSRTRLALLSALVPLVTPLAAQASTEYWKTTTGNWNVAGNWSGSQDLSSGGAVPVAGDTANIWNNDATNRTITLTANAAASTVEVANIGTGTTTFAQGAFNFATVNETIAGDGATNNAKSKAVYTQTGGTHTVTGQYSLAYASGAVGTYTMTSGTLNDTGAIGSGGFIIGYSGAGTFTQSGSSVVNVGTASKANTTYLGFAAGGAGTYNVNGGSFTTQGPLQVAMLGNGNFNQNGGTATINGDLDVAQVAFQTVGNVSINSGTFTVNGNTVLGGAFSAPVGTASMKIAGNVTLKDLFLNQTGSLALSGGSLTVNTVTQKPNQGHFTWTGGDINIPSVAISNDSLTANFGLFDGITTLNTTGTLNTKSYVLGSSSSSFTLTQNAGNVVVGTSALAGTFTADGGTYSLNNASKLTVYGNANLGNVNFNLNGGSMTVSGQFNTTANSNVKLAGTALSIAGAYISNANATQSGGTLTVGSGLTVNNGSFNQTGGTATIAGGLTATQAGAVVNVDGATTSMAVTGNTVIGAGTVAYSGLNIKNGGTFSTTGTLTLSAAAVVGVNGNFTAGQLQLNGGAFGETGGSVTNNGVTVLNSSPWNQSAGTALLKDAVNLYNVGRINLSGTGQLTASGLITLGNSTSQGVINLSGGTLNANNALNVSTASSALNVSGGILNATRLNCTGPVGVTAGTLNLGQTVSNGGVFALSGGTTTVGTEFDLPGGGAMNVSGTGVLKVNGNLYVGGNSTSVGAASALNISGGSATVTGSLVNDLGNVTLSGGSLTTNIVTVGGTFSQTAGTFSGKTFTVANDGKASFNGGTATLTGGSVTVADGGTLSGNTTIASPATINGSVQPGTDAAVGTLAFTNATLSSTAKTRIRVASATSTDHLNIGTATLGGTLQLSTLGSYVPAYGSKSIVMSGTAITGTFAKITGNQLADRWLAVTYAATNVSVTSALGGDTNLDGSVTFADLVSLAQHYNQTTGQSFATGDFDGTGGVDFADLVILAQNYNKSTAPALTLPANIASDWALAQSLAPEPTTALALTTFAVTILTRRQRRA